MRMMLLLVVMLAVAGAAKAQHAVYVSATSDTPVFITNAVKARIGATSRHTLTDSILEGEFVLNLVCHNTSPVAGFVCAYSTTLFSKGTRPLETPSSMRLAIKQYCQPQ